MNIVKFFTGIAVVALALSFIFFSTLVFLVTDWWWFSEVGFSQIFTISLLTKIFLFLGAAIFSLIFLLANFTASSYSKIPWMATIPESLVGQMVSFDNRLLIKIVIVASIILSLFFGIIVASSWQDVLKFIHATPFGIKDPIFEKDVGFYVFHLPILGLTLGIIKILTIFSLIGSIAIYILRGSFNLASFMAKLGKNRLDKTNSASPGARLHIAILLFILLLTIAADIYLSLFKLLTSQSGPVFGPVFTDVNVIIPLLRASMVASILVALGSLYWGIKGKISFLLGTIAIYFLLGLTSAFVPPIFNKLIVAPNELAKETPFIKNNILATREAFGLHNIDEREISGDKTLTSTDIANNGPTIKNVRLWDRSPLLSTFSQIQEIRTYYEFNSISNDRYIIDGEIRQTMLSLRELSSESLPNRSWINERFTFTHGYGITAGPVNQVTTEGLPVLFVKDLPPKSEVKELAINRPEIYFGELSNDYVFVKTKSKEFDYPEGEENVFTTYQGSAGVEIDSFAKRLFYAIRFNSLKILLSNDITHESKILYYRRIKERVSKIAPFLTFDRDPYAVIADGKIYWIMDGYTSTNLYPYSQPLLLNTERVNYIRNSAKLVLDAYNGTVTFYQADMDDPIINTYAKIFPKTFRPLSEMPKSLISHLRYPEDIFTLQTTAYTIYHMGEPQIFYNKEDQWEIPSIAPEGESTDSNNLSAIAPRHIIMKLPEEKEEEYILMLPFTPRGKDNLSAWMVARNDRQNYAKLLVYRFPKQKLIFGPKQVIARINQDAEISRQITLWDQRGSQVIKGPLLVIPIEESLIYVQPLYLKADAGKIPELKRVIVAYKNKIAMEETLEEGLAKIFGTDTTEAEEKEKKEKPIATAPPQNIQGIISQAIDTYENALRAQREGNWTRYGEEIKRLGEILKQ